MSDSKGSERFSFGWLAPASIGLATVAALIVCYCLYDAIATRREVVERTASAYCDKANKQPLRPLNVMICKKQQGSLESFKIRWVISCVLSGLPQ